MAEPDRDSRRSRSRVRSRLRNEFKARDTSSSSNNSTQLDNVIRPTRSSSKLSQGIKRESSDNALLHKALQNHNVRNGDSIAERGRDGSLLDYQQSVGRSKSSSARLLSDTRATKNIPMNTDLTPTRPLMKRWNSIQYLSDYPSADTVQFKTNKNMYNKSQNSQYLQQSNRSIDSSSISPLTVIKDQYNTKRPVSNVASTSTDNYYKDLETPPTHYPELNGSSDIDRDNKTTTTTPMESLTHKIYNKMSRLLQRRDETSSLQDITSQPTKDLNKETDKLVPLSTKTSISKFQSESDDESEIEEDPEIAGGDHFDLLSSPNVNLQDSSTMDEMNFDKIMNEINDFQHNFVQKYNANTPNSDDRQNRNQFGNEYDWDSSSRIQRKILDYKDLYQDESISKNSSYFSLKSQNQQFNYNLLNDYTFKIQHETIIHQYNSIRFRYLGLPDFDLYTIDGDKIPPANESTNYLRSNMGILGYLNRVKMVENHQLNQSNKNGIKHGTKNGARNEPFNNEPFHASSSPIQNPQEYLATIWQEEMESLFSAEADTVVNTPGDNSANKSSFSHSNISVAELASKVRLN